MSNTLEGLKTKAAFHGCKSADVQAEECRNYLVDTLECLANLTYLISSDAESPERTREYAKMAGSFLADANERLWNDRHDNGLSAQ